LTEHQIIEEKTEHLYFEGTGTNLAAGDRLLLIGADKETDPSSNEWDMRRVLGVEAQAEKQRTCVEVTTGTSEPPADVEVFVLRQRAAVFGHNAPDWNGLTKQIRKDYLGEEDDSFDDPGEWAFTLCGLDSSTCADLDSRYEKIVPDSWAYFESDDNSDLFRVTGVSYQSRAEYLISGETTRLTLEGPTLDPFQSKVRETKVYAAPEELSLAQIDLVAPVKGAQIDLQQMIDPLPPAGTLVIVQGVTVGGAMNAELAMVKSASNLPGRTRLQLEESLGAAYVRNTVKIYANVVQATHGETMADEALGGGDGASAHQQFMLKKPPLTHLSAATPSGNRAELTVRVNGVAWEKVNSLYGLPPEAKSYVVRLDNMANARIIFGDGKMGARLPTGQENARATYRSGIGLDGNVGAGTLTLLKTRPFGVSSVTNPLAAAGAADPETLASARSNAPLTVKTLDRIVSLQDYQDFARAFAGVGKAAAVELWDGRQALVHVTIAGPQGEPVPDNQLDKLRTAMDAARDPARELCLGGFEKLSFSLSAGVLIGEAYVRSEVEAAIIAALKAAYAFDERAFGQPVNSAGVISTIQAVAGVVAVDLDKLYVDGKLVKFNNLLTSRSARFDSGSAVETTCGRVQPAQLLLINPNGITLLEMAP
jgi:predicted phage baseplate assembly protein